MGECLARSVGLSGTSANCCDDLGAFGDLGGDDSDKVAQADCVYIDGGFPADCVVFSTRFWLGRPIVILGAGGFSA